MNQQYSTYSRSLLPALKQNGLEVVVSHEDLTKEQGAFVDRYFEENVYPVLTPMAVDSSRPFPLIRNKSLNIGASDCEKRRPRAKNWISPRCRFPSVLPRIWCSLPVTTDENDGEKRNVILPGGDHRAEHAASCSSNDDDRDVRSVTVSCGTRTSRWTRRKLRILSSEIQKQQ